MPITDFLGDNFKQSGLWERLLEYVGGDERRAIEWWDTPLGTSPFLGRTPRELMNEDEWDLVRVFLEARNTKSGAKHNYGVNNYPQDKDKIVLPQTKRLR
jgi:hypothetical protein